MDKQEVNFLVKIPGELNEKIKREADREKRSRRSQVVYLLEKFFETRDGGRKEKTK